MTDVVFREAPPPIEPTTPLPEPELNKHRVQSGPTDNEPVEIREQEGKSVVLDALGIDENVSSLPAEDKENLNEVKQYILGVVNAKGLSPTVSSFKKTLDSVKSEMGLDAEAEPSIVLDRIAGVVKAWRNLSFVKDPAEKRKIFYRLAKLNSASEMNREVYTIMNKYQVWE